MIISSIDFSMSSPGISKYDTNDELDFLNIKKYFLNTNKRFNKDWSDINLYGSLMPKFDWNMPRFDYITDWVIEKVKDSDIVTLEDYSFNSKGVVFNIGEITGLLKYKLYKHNIQFYPIGITKIKKDFSGKGNATKIEMLTAATNEIGFNLKTKMELKEAELSPALDIIDSYAQLKYVVNNLNDIIN